MTDGEIEAEAQRLAALPDGGRGAGVEAALRRARDDERERMRPLLAAVQSALAELATVTEIQERMLGLCLQLDRSEALGERLRAALEAAQPPIAARAAPQRCGRTRRLGD